MGDISREGMVVRICRHGEQLLLKKNSCRRRPPAPEDGAQSGDSRLRMCGPIMIYVGLSSVWCMVPRCGGLVSSMVTRLFIGDFHYLF